MVDILPAKDSQRLLTYWRLNALLACTIASTQKKSENEKSGVLKACDELVRKLGGDRESVKEIGSFYRTDDGHTFEVFVANLGQYGLCHLVASQKYGTCWYIAFSGVYDGALRGMFPDGRAD